MRNIKWGIIGLGDLDVANKFAQAIKTMAGLELEAVASSSKERSESFGRIYDVAVHKCYGSYEEIVQDENIDVIFVSVPHSYHKDVSVLCLKNGKSVLCEKPVTISEKEIIEVVKTAEKNKLFFMEGMKTRFLPVIQKSKEWINEGRIGEVGLLQADFGYRNMDQSHRVYSKQLGGGALLDIGIYGVSYSSFIFGNSPESITSSSYIGKTGVDENVSITLNYELGKQSQLYGAINLPTRREANIIGTEGRICIPKFSNAYTATIVINEKEEKIEMPFSINGFEYQIQEVVKCLKEGKLQSEIMSWKDSIEIMRIMDSIKENS